jgi:hypothetical protein
VTTTSFFTSVFSIFSSVFWRDAVVLPFSHCRRKKSPTAAARRIRRMKPTVRIPPIGKLPAADASDEAELASEDVAADGVEE